MILRVAGRVSLRLFGYDITTVGRQLKELPRRHDKELKAHARHADKELKDVLGQLDRLKGRASRLQSEVERLSERAAAVEDRARFLATLERATADPTAFWLYLNRAQRMDASLELFEEDRRRFHRARYEMACGHVAGKVAADVACGTGYGTEMLLRQGRAEKVFGVDIDVKAIEYAKSAHRCAGSEYVCAPGEASGLVSGSVDVVVSFETLEHVPNDTTLMEEFSRILRPGGVLICSVPNDWPLEETRHHVRAYRRDTFERLLKGRFKIDEMYNQNSGGTWSHNHGEPEGIRETTPENERTAECYVAVCRKPG